MATQRDDHGRIERAELPFQVGRAGRDLVGLGIAVAWRAALDDVRDEHVLAAPADVTEEVHEEASCATHERAALTVLVHSRALAHEDHLGRGVTLAGHRLRASLVETASCAHPDFRRDRLERRAALGVGHAAVPAAFRAAAALTQPRSTRISASWTAFVAAPLRRLSLTTQNARPRPSSIDGSWRTRPT